MWNKFKWLISGYRNHKLALTWLLVGTPLICAFYITEPLILKYIFDILSEGHGTLPAFLQPLANYLHGRGLSPLVGAVIIQIMYAVVIFVVYFSVQGTRAWMNTRLEWEFRQRAFDATTGKGPDFFNAYRTGDLVTRMTDDVAEKLSWFACSGIFRFYEAVLVVVLGVYHMLQLNVELTLYTVTPLPVLIVIFMLTSSALDRRFDRLQNRISDLNSLMEACFSGIRVVKAYSREPMWRRRFADTMGERRAAEISVVRAWAGIESLYMYIWQVGLVMVLLVGGAMTVDAEITVGDFVAFSTYVMFLVYPMFDIGQFVVKSRQSAVSIGRLMEIQNFAPMVTNHGPQRAPIAFERMRFEDVSFRFGANGHHALQNVSFEVERGDTVALVGRVGSGKSTLIQLLMRVIDPTEGRILLDDQPLRNLSLDDYRDIIGYVPQEPILFSDTIEGNIRFGEDAVASERVAEVVALSQLQEQMQRFPHGLQTRIGTRGLTISGGEKQRVAIARALARDPRILILDDCTSALDARTEERLWAALHEVMPDMTCFVVTHRTKTLRKADLILLLDEGRIVDSGTHDELIDRSHAYRELYSRSELEEEVTP